MSHSLQAVAVLAQAAGAGLAVPMAARIHEGIGWSKRRSRPLYFHPGRKILRLKPRRRFERTAVVRQGDDVFLKRIRASKRSGMRPMNSLRSCARAPEKAS